MSSTVNPVTSSENFAVTLKGLLCVGSDTLVVRVTVGSVISQVRVIVFEAVL